MINRYGLDTSYFEDLIKRELSNLENFTPSEFARVCARMAATADSSVLDEEEFSSSSRSDNNTAPTGSTVFSRCVDKAKINDYAGPMLMVIGGRMCGRASQAAEDDAFKASAALRMKAAAEKMECSLKEFGKVFEGVGAWQSENSRLIKSLGLLRALESPKPDLCNPENNQKFIQRKMQGKRRVY
tara:strand:+ start:49380 stop:49934 length:555 start_codon:yes stop_codon:yes gene_type:complete